MRVALPAGLSGSVLCWNSGHMLVVYLIETAQNLRLFCVKLETEHL